MSDFTDSLQQASFRGVPFAVLSAEGRFGRRAEIHEYPFRNKPWVEDLGRGTRRISFVAFLVADPISYDADPDVIVQRDAMIAACETADSGTLVHPTLGRLTVSCPIEEGGLVITERWDEQLYFELGLTFIESGDKTFPSASDQTGSASDEAADDVDDGAAEDYGTAWSEVVAEGQAVIGQVHDVAVKFCALAFKAISNATRLYNLLVFFPGNFGRFFSAGTFGFAGQLSPPPGTPDTIPGLIQQGAADRGAVNNAIAALETAAAGDDPAAVSTASTALLAAFLAATPDPGTAIVLLAELADFFPDATTTESIIGQAMAAIQEAAGALFRRGVLAALVRACALYQPSSRDDAANLRDQVTALLDAEILVAGDTADDASYAALRALRVAVINDLNVRGAALPPMQVFNFAANLPSLVLAQTLYQDVTRADQLVTQANPAHPAFMPLSFSALGE